MRISADELDFVDDSSTYERHFDGRNPEPNHPHVFKEQGTYEAKLRVVDDSNEAGETKVVVTITDPRKRKASRALRNAKRN